MPAHQRLGLDDNRGFAHGRDQPIEPDEDQAICRAQPEPCWRRPLQDHKLLAEKCRLGFASRMRSEQSDEQAAEQLQEVKHPKARIAHRGICASPDTIFGSHRIAQQISEAFPWDEAPRYLIRDRDTSYGAAVTRRLQAMGIRDRPITPRSPWQNGHVERLIGSIRRECLDHVVVLGERHLRHRLANYATYYKPASLHPSLYAIEEKRFC